VRDRRAAVGRASRDPDGEYLSDGIAESIIKKS